MTTTSTVVPQLEQIADVIRRSERFVLSSHARPDGDAIGSQLAMAFALGALGKHVRVINRDAPPAAMMAFPGVPDIEVAERVDGRFDAAIIMECGDLSRTGVAGLDQFFVINVDHHQGNTGYGRINWFDPSRAACAEMVYDIVRALGVPLSVEIATHLYLAILTDTGAFHYSGISPRTFEICREAVAAGVDPTLVARQVYDTNPLSRVKLFGAVLGAMRVDDSGRIAVLYLDHEIARQAGGTYDDTEGLINFPLSVKDIQAVIFFKQDEGDEYRVSLRSKGDVDVAAVCREYGGGGHKNAAGCTMTGAIEGLREEIVKKVQRAVGWTAS
jgi:phosphoesterase RecJ-like protein